MNGGLLWEGDSCFDSEPIMVPITGLIRGSVNEKIGPMAQAWIMPRDVHPQQAQATGADFAVCGDCAQRRYVGGCCYVQWQWGPKQVWHTRHVFKSYQQLEPANLEGVHLRFGAWGDPAAIPIEVWRPILPLLAGRAGYTHQWSKLDPIAWGWLMASVDSVEEYERAKDEGWRAFRIRAPGAPLLAREIECPGAATAGSSKRVTCYSCGLCGGWKGRAIHAKDVSAVVHGHRKHRFGRRVAA